MDLPAGSRWQSAVCDTQVIVVRPPSEPVDLRCGGHPMVSLEAEPPAGAALSEADAGGTAVGKRFTDDDTGLEVLCTRGGQGSLALGERPLTLKGAKPLPSSD